MTILTRRATRISTLAGLGALIVASVLLQGTGAATSAPAKAGDTTGGPAAQSISRAAAAARSTELTSWHHPVFQDSLLDSLAASRNLVLIASGEPDQAEANLTYESAAWVLDVMIRRVDGEAGESNTAYLDDWVSDPVAATELHGMLVQARSEVLRQRSE